ncbi:MAG: hypothetical protein NVS1B10_07480 [Candidatus Saccharimonadales bacterium]
MDKMTTSENDNDRLAKAKQLGNYSVISTAKIKKNILPLAHRKSTKIKANKKSHTIVLNWALIILFLLSTLLSGFAGAWLQANSSNLDMGTNSLSSQRKIISSQGQLISQIAKKVGPSVVSVNVSIANAQMPDLGVFGLSAPSRPAQAAGTGIIISSDGQIVTNRHVVPSGTTKVSVTLSDGTQLNDVSVLGRTGTNDTLDVAFLKINNSKGHKLVPASIGDSSKVQVGDNVVAIGNALGQFQNTVTSGIISGFGRSVQASDSSGSSSSSENLDNLFQTDAAINEGNSGGPLVNLYGQVIGLNTAVAGGAQNIGFSIPVNDIHGLISQVLKTGKFVRPYLGVHYVALTADTASQLGVKAINGAYILPSTDANSPSVIPGSPASRAGLRDSDVITHVNDKKIDQTHSLVSLLSQHQPGDSVKLTVLRNDKKIIISLTLGSLPQ